MRWLKYISQKVAISTQSMLLASAVVVSSLLITPLSPAVSAETVTCGNGNRYEIAESDASNIDRFCADKGGATGARVESSNPTTFKSVNMDADCNPEAGVALNEDNCGIVAYLLLFTNLLAGLVGIVVVLMIIWGGIKYITAKNDPQAVGAAKKHIYDALIALVLYVFMFAFLQWAIPGGLF